MLFNRVAIIGAGLIGGSLGIALRAQRIAGMVVGVGHRKVSLDRAFEMGAVDEATLDAHTAVADADLVVLATRVGLILQHVEKLIPYMKPGALLTDVGSIKAAICATARTAMKKHSGPPIRFVGSHPLAGSEKRGIEAARENLFQGATCILTPEAETDPDGNGATQLRAMWEAVGCRVMEFSPAKHDQILAEVSHLPHVTAAALINAISETALPMAASGFADTTRIASGDPGLWADICLENRDSILPAIENMRHELKNFTAAIRDKDASRLAHLFIEAKQSRDQHINNHQAPAPNQR